MVTPLAGVWIEISVILTFPSFSTVTPLAGVWIEMCPAHILRGGLPVTPLAGVWIEIPHFASSHKHKCCHSPCGSVD